MSFSPLSTPFPVASSAVSGSVSRITPGVLGAVFMALWAVSFAGHVDAGFTTAHVFQHGHGFQMVRVNTASDAAQVVERQVFGYRLSQKFVGNSMGQSHYAGNFQPSVTFGATRQAEPTARFRDRNNLIHQTLKERPRFAHVPSYAIAQEKTICL